MYSTRNGFKYHNWLLALLWNTSAYLPHVFSKLNVMHLYEVNVLELHSFQRLMDALCDTSCTEVCWLTSYVFPDLCCNYDLIPGQMLDCSTQQLQTEQVIASL